jgi:hypothetical protein
MDAGSGLWLYRDASGAEHLVQSLDEVPRELRSHARPAGVAPLEGISAHSGPLDALTSLASSSSEGLHAPSFVLGFAAAAALGLALFVARQAPRWILRLVVLTAVAAVGVVGYFTWIRHQAGFAGLGTPSQLIEDARHAAQLAREQQERQQEQLQETE